MHLFSNFVNDLGLVPMRIMTGDFAPYQLGAIAGFSPDEAERLYLRQAAVPVDAEGDELVFNLEAPQTAAPTVTTEQVAIPLDWESSHHLQRIKLARAITGSASTDTMNVLTADEIIRAEIERRKS